MPETGDYYCVPVPTDAGRQWELCTSRDAGLDPDVGHTELWLFVLDRLAIAWAKDRYAVLPRGRVTRPSRSYLILHGRDAPLIHWRRTVAERFDLASGRIRSLYDEHERMIAGDPEAVERALGVDLGLRGL